MQQIHAIIYFFLFLLAGTKQYAVLLSCFSKDNLEFCLIQQFEEMELNGDAMVNDYDCPLLTLAANITIIHSSIVIQSVFIVHECTSTCVFTTLPNIRTVEREGIELPQLIFKHDWTNVLLFECIFYIIIIAN